MRNMRKLSILGFCAFWINWHNNDFSTVFSVTIKCDNFYTGKYLLFWDIYDLKNAFALTNAFLSYIVTAISLLRPLSTGILQFVLGLI